MKKFAVWLGAFILSVYCFSSLEGSLAVQPTGQVDPHRWSHKQRGVSWVGSSTPVTLQDFATLDDNHVNWIVQTPFGWQDDFYSPIVTLETDGSYWGGTDTGLAKTTEFAKRAGIQTLLKPHIWLTNPRYGQWRTEIEMYSEQDWQTWFETYGNFILHYANFAEVHQIPVFSIGTELQTTAIQREQDWRQLIVSVRQVYHGKITYAANWDEAFEAIQFWDALDFIGIQAYFPLSHTRNPSLEELKAAWRYYLPNIEQVQTRFQKPIIFTELGYRSTEDTAIAPWEWPLDSELEPQDFATEADLEAQKNCYEAFFQIVWPQDWFAGVYIWKWFPELDRSRDHYSGDRIATGKGFTPQNKPAERVLQQWFRLSHSDFP